MNLNGFCFINSELVSFSKKKEKENSELVSDRFSIEEKNRDG